MKRFHAHVSTMQPALQQRPKVLKAIGVYAAIYVLNRVIYDLMLELIMESFVSAHLISVECGSSFDVLTNDGLQGFLLAICNDLSADLAATLQQPHDDGLVSEALTHASYAPCVNILVHVASLATNESLVGFNFAAVATELASEVLILHDEPDTVKHEPCSLLSNLYIALNLPTADSILAIGDEPSCGEPLVQRDSGIFHHSSNLDGEFALRMNLGALPSAAFGVERAHFVRPASWTEDNPIRPAMTRQIVNAVIGIREVLNRFLQAAWFAHKCLTYKLNSTPKSLASQVNYYPK